MWPSVREGKNQGPRSECTDHKGPFYDPYPYLNFCGGQIPQVELFEEIPHARNGMGDWGTHAVVCWPQVLSCWDCLATLSPDDVADDVDEW